MGRFVKSILLVAIASSIAAAQQEAQFVEYANDPFSVSQRNEEPQDLTTRSERDNTVSSYESKENLMSPVHRKAQFRSQQRQLLLASRKWYGHSQMRPVVYANPYMTSYTPFYPVVPVVTQTAQRPFRTWSGASYSWY